MNDKPFYGQKATSMITLHIFYEFITSKKIFEYFKHRILYLVYECWWRRRRLRGGASGVGINFLEAEAEEKFKRLRITAFLGQKTAKIVQK